MGFTSMIWPPQYILDIIQGAANIMCCVANNISSAADVPHYKSTLPYQHKGRLKKTTKKMTLCRKGGGVRKKSNFECIIKSDILLGEGG